MEENKQRKVLAACSAEHFKSCLNLRLLLTNSIPSHIRKYSAKINKLIQVTLVGLVVLLLKKEKKYCKIKLQQNLYYGHIVMTTYYLVQG